MREFLFLQKSRVSERKECREDIKSRRRIYNSNGDRDKICIDAGVVAVGAVTKPRTEKFVRYVRPRPALEQKLAFSNYW